MKEPIFLSTEQILALHERAIAAHGGTLGIRDRGGLDSAINHPKNYFITQEVTCSTSVQRTLSTLPKDSVSLMEINALQ